MEIIIIQSIITGMMIGFIYALVSVGLSLLYGIMDIINFAHGEMLMVGMFASYWLWALGGVDPLYSIPLVGGVLALLGVLVYKGIIRQIYGSSMLTQVFATFGLSIFLSSSAQFLFTPNVRAVKDPLIGGNLRLGEVFISIPELFAVVMSAGTFALLYWFLEKTATGRALRATSENRNAASLMGINTERMYYLGWAISIGLVGIAGGVLASYYYVFPGVGGTFALMAYVAVALGGFGNVMGAFVGGIVIGIVENVTGVLFLPVYKYIGIFLVYLLVVLLRPQGILGKS